MATKADTGLGIEHRRKQNIVCKWGRIMERRTDIQTGKNRLQLLDALGRPFRSGHKTPRMHCNNHYNQ